jgi:hypothetical protein
MDHGAWIMHYHPPDGTLESKLFGLVIGAIFLFAAGLVCSVAYWQLVTSRWPAVECTILNSRVEMGGAEKPYAFDVMYRYDWNGERHLSRSYKRQDSGTSDLSEVERLVASFPANARRTCFVNPQKPGEATIIRESPWPGFGMAAASLLIAVLFVQVYLFASPRRRGFVDGWKSPQGRIFLVVLGTTMMIFGAGAFVLLFGIPLRKTFEARKWNLTRASVVSSEIHSTWMHSHEVRLPIHWANIVYTYHVNGHDYRSNTYNLTDVPTPWYYGKRRMAHRFPPGSQVNCFVNPSDPFEAVLTTHLSATWWLSLWPLLMSVLGIACAVGALTNRLSSNSSRSGSRQWLIVVLGIPSTITTVILVLTGSDLFQDWKAGTAEWKEFATVGVAAAITLVMVFFLAKVVRRAISLHTATRIWLIR